ncbi:MAG: uncharacterized protein A8A55_2019 [Amphiamblys sp. WSBS2006]|nr:MAG: uncharacterized protein A8A55_2019 [Amphiamblys sp. WSBS2006]
MCLKNYAVSILPKVSYEGSEIELLILYAGKEEQVAEILAQEQPFCVGRVKNMELREYAVSILPKLRIHEDNTIEKFVLSVFSCHFSRILEGGDNSIELGRIRQGGFHVPEGIRRKLRYTLVDGEGKEMLEEERSSSQRGTLFD